MKPLHRGGQWLAFAFSLWLAGTAQSSSAAIQDRDAGGETPRRLPALVPRPSQVEVQRGIWVLDSKTRLVSADPAAAEAAKLADALAPPLGWRLPIADGPPRTGDVVLSLDDSRVELGGEGYEMRVTPEGVRMTARRAAGFFYASQTLRQLLPDAAWRQAPVDNTPWVAPCVRIVDKPRFGWRGLLLDPARHFIAKAALREIIDAICRARMNCRPGLPRN